MVYGATLLLLLLNAARASEKLTSQQDKTGTNEMRINAIKFIILISLLNICGNTNAQCDGQEFFLRDKNRGFETSDGTGYTEIEIIDSASFDSYISTIYATLSESYPRANIKIIGNRIVQMDATSLGIHVSKETGGFLNMYVDFSMTIEIREKKSGATNEPDKPCVRFHAPFIKKLTFYNPYYMSHVKQYLTKPNEMHEALMENGFASDRPMSCSFIFEIGRYIIHNINAELNQNHYRTFLEGRYYNSLGKKDIRKEW